MLTETLFTRLMVVKDDHAQHVQSQHFSHAIMVSKNIKHGSLCTHRPKPM